MWINTSACEMVEVDIKRLMPEFLFVCIFILDICAITEIFIDIYSTVDFIRAHRSIVCLFVDATKNSVSSKNVLYVNCFRWNAFMDSLVYIFFGPWFLFVACTVDKTKLAAKPNNRKKPCYNIRMMIQNEIFVFQCLSLLSSSFFICNSCGYVFVDTPNVKDTCYDR